MHKGTELSRVWAEGRKSRGFAILLDTVHMSIYVSPQALPRGQVLETSL